MTAVSRVGLVGLCREAPAFKVKAIQVDGGSEFCAQFEDACKELGIRLFVLPPRSPKLKGHVDRAQRTHTESASGGYEIYDGDLDITPSQTSPARLGEGLQYRPSSPSLGYLTPLQFLRQNFNLKKNLACH